MSLLFSAAIRWFLLGIFTRKVRFPFHAIVAQVHRVGVRSLPIVLLVQLFIGIILALQMTPPLQPLGQEAQVARIIGVAGFRMLGPILTAIILSGFAGASIAAELGSMVVAEEIEAMKAMAMNPVRYLVVPRILATFIATVLLTIISNLLITLGGYIPSRLVLGSTSYIGYWQRIQDQLEYLDLITGLIQAGIFGILISLIACYEGLKVRGGPESVGKATTMTVVYSIVAIVCAACVCTIIFYVFEL